MPRRKRLAAISSKRCIDCARMYPPGYAVYITLGDMKKSSFTIEFPTHLAQGDWQDFIVSVTRAGATVEQLSSHVVRLNCENLNYLQHVGYILFNSQHSNLFKVTSVAGEAQLSARAYASAKLPEPNPSIKRDAALTRIAPYVKR